MNRRRRIIPLAVLLLLAVLAWLAGCTPAPAGAATGTMPSVTDTSPTISSSATPSMDSDNQPIQITEPVWDNKSADSAQQTAQTIWAAWARPQLSHDQWLAGITPLLTPDFAASDVVTSMVPSSIKGVTVSASGVHVYAASSAFLARAIVFTVEDGPWLILLARTDGVAPWLAADITRYEM